MYIMQGSVYIGTSGWSYKHWGEKFFPPGMKSVEQLAFYARHFNTVEINASFYRLPFKNMVKGWHDRAPDGFIFAAKGHRLITHYKKLKHVAANTDTFINRIKGLKEHLGPLLWQLPPNFTVDPPRLDKFLARLPRTLRHAVEFRHPSWVTPEVFDILRRHDVAHVNLSSMRMPRDLTVTTDFIYIRFHGLADGGRHDYTRDELAPWRDHIAGNVRHGRAAYAYFNNDGNVRAPKNAEELRRMVEQATAHARAA